MIGKQIPRINNTIIKKWPYLFGNNVTFSFRLLLLVLHTVERVKAVSDSMQTELLSIL